MGDETAVSPALQQLRLEQTARSGASWFYWIAGLSAVNSLAWWLKFNWSFSVGLGLTKLSDALGSYFGVAGLIGAIAFDLLLAGALVAVGRFALRYPGVWIGGMVFYALDGLVTLYFRDFISTGFHVFALGFMLGGFRVAGQLRAVGANGDVPGSTGAPVYPSPLREPRPTEDVEYFAEEAGVSPDEPRQSVLPYRHPLDDVVLVSGRAGRAVSLVAGWLLIAIAGLGAIGTLAFLGPLAMDAGPDPDSTTLAANALMLGIPLALCGLSAVFGFRFVRGARSEAARVGD